MSLPVEEVLELDALQDSFQPKSFSDSMRDSDFFKILWHTEGLLIKDSKFWDYAPMKWIMHRSISEDIENPVLKIADYIWDGKEFDFPGFFEDISVKHLSK